MAQTGPIVIHSLFRCASTFFFQKFRALGAAFTCYQEPFNESLEALNRRTRQARLLACPGDPRLRHPPLDQPYFLEFWLRRAQLRGLYNRAFAYREYFCDAGLPPAQQRWLAALLEHAEGRPVLQFCRSSGRARALRSFLGGTHVHLWREPRVQWWSYKVADYFDSVTRRIYDSSSPPAPLARLADGVTGRRLRNGTLTPQENYSLFYALWLDAWLRLIGVADVSISIDRIAVSAADNRSCAQRLTGLVGQSIELADIRASGQAFTAEELDFYERIEEMVGSLFVRTGHASAALVRSAEAAAADVRLAHAQRAHDAPAERNLRQATLTMMERLAGVERAPLTAWRTRLDMTATALLQSLRGLWQPRPRPRPRPTPPETDGMQGSAPLLSALGSQSARDDYHRG